MIDGEPFTGSAEPSHHLIRDEHDAELVAKLTYPCHVPGWRHHDARRARYRFEHDCRDGARPFQPNSLLQMSQRAFGLLLLIRRVEH
ncbi:Uncharacterised protein [Mycobacteroides abscessus subsp. abscessus]|nr:Uncharacterised protein [Mycobacteroides abscessus subsp. abscessus]